MAILCRLVADQSYVLNIWWRQREMWSSAQKVCRKTTNTKHTQTHTNTKHTQTHTNTYTNTHKTQTHTNTHKHKTHTNTHIYIHKHTQNTNTHKRTHKRSVCLSVSVWHSLFRTVNKTGHERLFWSFDLTVNICLQISTSRRKRSNVISELYWASLRRSNAIRTFCRFGDDSDYQTDPNRGQCCRRDHIAPHL